MRSKYPLGCLFQFGAAHLFADETASLRLMEQGCNTCFDSGLTCKWWSGAAPAEIGFENFGREAVSLFSFVDPKSRNRKL